MLFEKSYLVAETYRLLRNCSGRFPVAFPIFHRVQQPYGYLGINGINFTFVIRLSTEKLHLSLTYIKIKSTSSLWKKSIRFQFSKFYILWSYLELVLFFDNKSAFHKIYEFLLTLFQICSLKIRSHEYTFNPYWNIMVACATFLILPIWMSNGVISTYYLQLFLKSS